MEAVGTGWPVTAVGMAVGFGLDAVLADPRRGHPVGAFGTLAGLVERLVYRDSRLAGAVYAAGLTGTVVWGGRAFAGHGRSRRAAWAAAATWTVLGGSSLRREARAVGGLLSAGDLPGARRRLPALCGRDPAALDAGDLSRAVVESVAENTSDAVVGPLVWGAVAGVPGLLAYRAVNTLDAMVGHRSPRYARFGWAAARLDDLANVVPARVTAALAVLLAPSVGGRRRSAARVWRRDGGKHPSPNAGQVEAAFAGALGRTLGGQVRYGGVAEERPLLGDGPAVTVADIARAVQLSRGVGAAAAAACVVVAAARR